MKIIFALLSLVAVSSAHASDWDLDHHADECPALSGTYLASATSGTSTMTISQEPLADDNTKYIFTGNGAYVSYLANGLIHYFDESNGGTGGRTACNKRELHSFWINKGKLQEHSIFFFGADGKLYHHFIDGFGDKTYLWKRLGN